MRTIALIAILMLGCEASFTDLRPEALGAGDMSITARDMGSGSNATPNNVNNVAPNNMLPGDASTPTVDGGLPDAPPRDVPAPMDEVLAEGMFVPRADYGGEGTATLVELADGGWELRIGDDFRVGSVPGPVVVLAREDSLGSSLDPARGDMELGVLSSNNGASTYTLPGDPEDRRIVWIYCKPFGLQMTSAQLADP